jgi:hypothetical protein
MHDFEKSLLIVAMIIHCHVRCRPYIIIHSHCLWRILDLEVHQEFRA